ncbi:ion transporter [Halpernia frigidisoli]|uniref:Voltage-gated potassium channel n=1 Tax=Halpernia frigidisoli TaxID=1125876 RepID=A0A1I3DCP6_9FLAO|nr:ion transporter [Halpernia frigidisoli]SFH84505.1 voltage-gated potassium channel [Halpernia frigidisoli]
MEKTPLEYDYTPQENPFLKRIYRVIYFSDTKAGKLFDIALLLLIFISTFLVMLETVNFINVKYSGLFFTVQMIITVLFSIEYILRILTIKDKKEYIFSPLGIIDFISIIPFYLSLIFPVLHFFVIVRMLRMLRVFRIFNLADYQQDGRFIVKALKESSRKIYIFLLFLIIFIIIIGSLMFVIEGGRNGFSSIPQSIYWAVVTITTVGYGDISPVTSGGKFLAIIVMLCGYSIIAVPTGIVSSQFRRQSQSGDSCDRCGNGENDKNARFCKICGEKILDK